MEGKPIKRPNYDGNACMLYDYMTAQGMKEEDVVHMMGLVKNDRAPWCPVSTWISDSASIPMRHIPDLCRALNAPIEAIYMKSRILNGESFSLYGRFVRVEKQCIGDIPSEKLIQELKKRGFKVYKEV